MTWISECTTRAKVSWASRWAWRRRFENARNVLATTTVGITLIGGGAGLFDQFGTKATETVLLYAFFVGIGTAIVVGLLPVRTIVRDRVKLDEEVTIEVVVGDILDKKTSDNAIVVPTNVEGECTLQDADALKGRIRMSSVQGQYTRWMEDQGCGPELYQTIEEWRREFVHGCTAEEIDGNRGKVIPVGRKQEHRAYWFVLGRLLSAEGTLITESEYLEGLSKGWYELAKVSGREDLVSPVIGGGQMKLPRTTTGLIRDLVHTFIDAQSRIRVCKRLTIVVLPEGLKGVKLSDISETVTLECRRFRRIQRERQGSENDKGTAFRGHE